MDYTPSRGKQMPIYPSVVAALGFKSARNGQYWDGHHPGAGSIEDFQVSFHCAFQVCLNELD